MRKLTHEQYIKKLEKRSSLYKSGGFELVSDYVNSRTPVLVKDKYGVCSVSPNNLYKNTPPSIQTAVDKNEYCKNQFKEVHGDKYDYSKINYIGSNIKLTIVCPEHGEFEQSAHCHLIGQGCYECVRYSRLDGRRLTIEKFIKNANKVHNNKYNYSSIEEINGNKTPLPILCNLHGEFKQGANSHLKGSGCPTCYLENNGYSKSNFTYFAEGKESKLYLLECSNENESFLKIGITCNTIKSRFSGNRELPYEYKILKILRSDESDCIWEEEVSFKRKFRVYKYNPKIKFQGYTECFNIENKKEIINYLNTLENGLCLD